MRLQDANQRQATVGDGQPNGATVAANELADGIINQFFCTIQHSSNELLRSATVEVKNWSSRSAIGAVCWAGWESMSQKLGVKI